MSKNTEYALRGVVSAAKAKAHLLFPKKKKPVQQPIVNKPKAN